MIIFKQKQYTQWDNTDQLKKMRDSDILAEKPKSSMTMDTAKKTGLGMAGGAALGSVAGGIMGLRRGKPLMKSIKNGAVVGGLVGGATIGTAAAINNTPKQREINFYNDRLKYAQGQARRREKADWKNNMTQREGYTY